MRMLPKEMNPTGAPLDLGGSNHLIDLAARIKAEHEAVSVALKDSVRHAIEAGSLLLEAKEQLKHGQWLPWLRDNCTMSERTAQLYMRCAKSCEDIEKRAALDHACLMVQQLRAAGGYDNAGLVVDVLNELGTRVLSVPFLAACA